MADAVSGNLLGLQWQFARSERWPAAKLQAQQFRQIATLVAHCAEHVPFWRDRLAQAGLSPRDALSATSWARLPVLTRREVQQAGSARHATPPPAHHGRLSRATTSGSTGMPLSVLKTELSQFFWHGFVLRELLWNDWDPGGKLAIVREDTSHLAPPPDGLSLADWGPSVSRVFPTGPAAALDMQAPIAVQAAWLQQQDPDYLLTWGTNLGALARHCLDTGIRPGRLRVVRSVAEQVSPALRALCHAAWGAKLVDAYSAEEVGYIALQCPLGEHYHVQSEGLLLEVLDDAGAPCPPGQVGRVVVTPLHNFAMPLLRYELGDAVEAGVPCTCGRTLPTLARILGRTRDRLVLPGGERRFAYNPSAAFAAVRSIEHYQIAQIADDVLEIRMVARSPLDPAEQALLADALAAAIGHRFTLRFVYLDVFPRTVGTKFRDVVCEIG